MKKVNAVIGGEGNGGVIVPDLHYGRDALIGLALFLSHLANSNCTPTQLKSKYPKYEMAKKRMELSPSMDVDSILEKIKSKYSGQKITDIDGVRIDFESERKWVHLRKSNTEPIIRIYAEAQDAQQANDIASKIISDINTL
jgi:phosphomannomutase